MCERNSLDKKKKIKKRSHDRMCKRNSPHKKGASVGCVKELPRNVGQVIFEEMCQFRFCLPVSISVSHDLFVFVLFCKAFF